MSEPKAIAEPEAPREELVEFLPGRVEADRLALEKTWGREPGFVGWLSSTNHKDIGLRYVGTAFLFFLLGGLLAALMRVQLAAPGNTFLDPDQYNQVFTTHGTTMMFLFAVPVMEGMGLYLVPLMIGTRNVAFPKLMNFGYYVYLIAGLLLYVSFALDIGPDMGWFSYVPLAGPEFGPGKRTDVWSQVVTLVEISAMVNAVEVITTVLKQRAPGMSLNRIPLFVWAQVVASFMILFAMPAVTVCSTMLTMDRLTNVGTQLFNQAEGGDALLWQHLFWFFGHPDVYIFFLPAVGFISSILPTFCRRKQFGYTPLVLSMIGVAFIGFGVWVHHMFTTPLPRLGQGMFTASSLMIVIPNGIQIFCWAATLWAGRPVLKTPMLFVLGFFAIFVLGGMTGVILASVSIDRQVHDTYFVVAHFHYVLIGGAVFPLFGAFYYWFPKWTGRLMSERLGKLSFWLTFLGFNLTFFPMHQLGLQGMTRRIYTYLPEEGWADLNLAASLGAALLALGVLALIVNGLWSRKRGLVAGDDPWGAGTLEWATTSPPPPYNFLHPPTVRGSYPVWENPPDTPVVVGLSSRHREVLITSTHEAAPDHRYHMSGDSLWPFSLAVVTGGTLIGLIFHPVAVPVGGALALATAAGWFWPSHEPKPIHNPGEEALSLDEPGIEG